MFVSPGLGGSSPKFGGRATGAPIVLSGPSSFLVFSEEDVFSEAFCDSFPVFDSAFLRCKIPLGLHADSRPKNSEKHRLRAIFLNIKLRTTAPETGRKDIENYAAENTCMNHNLKRGHPSILDFNKSETNQGV